MPTVQIVEALDIVKHIGTRFVTGAIDASVHALGVQGAKKAFRPGLPDTARALRKAKFIALVDPRCRRPRRTEAPHSRRTRQAHHYRRSDRSRCNASRADHHRPGSPPTSITTRAATAALGPYCISDKYNFSISSSSSFE